MSLFKDIIERNKFYDSVKKFSGEKVYNLAISFYQTQNEDIDMLVKLMEVAESKGNKKAVGFLAELYFMGYKKVKQDYNS